MYFRITVWLKGLDNLKKINNQRPHREGSKLMFQQDNQIPKLTAKRDNFLTKTKSFTDVKN